MSSKRGRTGKSHVGKTKGRKKEERCGPRYRVSAGEDFPDLRQPSRREVWLGRLKKLAKWVGAAIVGQLVKTLVDRSLD